MNFKEIFSQIYTISENEDNWKAFLRTAGRIHKYSFKDQTFIHIQRPDAVACATMDIWNNRMNRWIKRGSKSIKIISNNKAIFLFDYSDTYPVNKQISKNIFWNINGIENKLASILGYQNINTAIEMEVNKLYTATVKEQLTDIEENFVKNSSLYAVKSRLNLPVDDIKFNNINLVKTEYIGNHINTICKLLLNQIEVIAKKERDIQNEGQTELQRNAAEIHTRELSDFRGTNDSERYIGTTPDENSTISRGNREYLDRTDSTSGTGDGGTEDNGYDSLGLQNEQYQETSTGNSEISGDNHLEYYDRSKEDKSLPFLHSENTVHAILLATPHLKASKEEIRKYFETERDPDKQTEYIKSIFNNDYTQVVIADGRTMGYKTYQNVLHLWEGDYQNRTAQAYYDWGVIAKYFDALRLMNKLDKTNTSGNPVFSFTQEIIDSILTRGSGIEDGKMHIYEQFSKSLSKQENIEFLKNEYGWGGAYPAIIGTDIDEQHDGKGITLSKGFDDKTKILLKWPDVEKRIAQLIKMDRYLNPKEKEQYPQWLTERDIKRAERAEKIKNKEILSTSNEKPVFNADNIIGKEIFINNHKFIIESVDKKSSDVSMRDITFESNNKFPINRVEKLGYILDLLNNTNKEPEYIYEYHLGDKVYLGASEYEILSFDENRVMLYDYSFPLLNKELTREKFDNKVKENPYNNHLRVEKAGQPTDILSETTEAADTEKGNDEHLPSNETITEIKAENPDAVLLYQVGAFYELYDKDAEYIADTFGLNLTPKMVDGNRVNMCGIPDYQLELYLNLLIDRGFDVAICTLEKDERVTRLVVSQEKPNPAQTYPVGRIEYTDKYGNITERVEYTSEYKFKKDVIEEQEFDTPMNIVLYRNKDGKTIKQDFLSKISQTKFIEIEDFPNVEITQKIETNKSQNSHLAWEKKKAKTNSFDLHPDIPLSERNDFDLKSNPIEIVGKKERFKRNIEAVKLLKQCETENRFATPQEQIILSKYVGWGGLSEAFDDKNTSWSSEYVQLKNLLSEEEYSAARESTLTAFYTPPEVISAIYKTMENMGFKEGNLLEPACGIGHFIGMLPNSMKNSKVYGVELDNISAGIARQLYQTSSIANQGFEETNLPDSFFDGVIGNVPFGDFKVVDKRYDKHKFLIHDYFFAKSLDKLRPGGVMALITSKGTMDKENSSVRKYIAQRAEFLGAIRLPNNAFKGNAGTEVVSDILFLQKRDRLIDIEPDWVHLNTDKNGIKMNSYFVEHPDMILGEMKMVTGRFGMESTCEPYENAKLSELLNKSIIHIQGEIPIYEEIQEQETENTAIPADPEIRNFSYGIVDGKVYYRTNSVMMPVNVSSNYEIRIKELIKVRDCVRKLIELQTEDYSDEDIKSEQIKLNGLYDNFTKKYGIINSKDNKKLFREDNSYSLLASLEVLDDEGNFVKKADMFSKRTIKPHISITSVDTANEALAVSIGEKACIDMEYMEQLTGKTEQELFTDLKGIIFLNPLYGYGTQSEAKYLMADEYLSGNVREKLKTALNTAKLYPDDYQINVEALQKVQPKDLSAGEISVRLGSTWLPQEVVQQFMFEFLETPRYAQWNIKVHYSPYTSEWNIEGKNYDRSNVKAYSTYGTSRINAYKIIEETLNLKDVRIFDYEEDEDGRKKAVLNKKETAIAQAKQDLIKQGFANWIWTEPKRREKLTKLYNEKFNSIRPREYDGSHITFNGMNPEIKLRKHQINAVARIIYGGNTLLAHVVGAGKTFEMVAASQESKRLGLCNKSMFVVPNHLIEQWATEYLQLYPSANILVSTKKDFEKQNRRKFCGRIATGDYDAVIIGQSQFEKIPISFERQRDILEQQIDELTRGIEELKRSKGENFSIKQLEKSKKAIKQKLEKLNDQSRKDDVVTFEELGVDRLFIDEAHYYKNLAAFTKMRNVAGISQTEAQKSSDLYMKCRYLDEITGGKGIIFATGTPISNTMVEMYTMQKYLQYDTLKKNGLIHFDAWASTFGETVTAIELSPEGTGYRPKTRFAKFYNLPELMAMFKEVSDVQTADMLNLPVPKVKYHNVVLKPSEQQIEMVKTLSERAEKIRNNMVSSNQDNMLLITNDGRKLALDQRMINPLLPDFDGSKINVCAENVFRIWEETSDKKSTQLIFCDLSTPKNDGSFNVYDDIRNKLIKKGIPKEEIKFIHEADTDVKKKELFSKVRSGQVRVLIGSTQKMGAGTNVQKILIALHHLDCPWKPSDLQQREGRIIRQGNTNKEVDIYTYVTEKTFDSYLYQLVESKQKFIGQIMTSKSPARSAEDIDETALSYAEIKALCSGNPLIKEKMDLDVSVRKLQLLKSSFLSEKYTLEDKIVKFYPQLINSLELRLQGLEKDIEIVKQNPKNNDKFIGMKIYDNFYSEKVDAGNAILSACQSMTHPDEFSLGEYRGFKTSLLFNTFEKVYQLKIKGNISINVELGQDVIGNITRIDNALERYSELLEDTKTDLENTKKQFETAKNEVQKPFVQEEELRTKTARLNELNILLNLDKKDNDIIEDKNEEQSDNTPLSKKLSDLNNNSYCPNNNKKSNKKELSI